ncbi:hypothetical protein NEOC95_000420 [Neochlamydia sp. AcF95]|nr:hypothetical protein [Neochlamydia sp. AcF95]
MLANIFSSLFVYQKKFFYNRSFNHPIPKDYLSLTLQ